MSILDLCDELVAACDDTLAAQAHQQEQEQRRMDEELMAGRYVSVLDELTGKRVRIMAQDRTYVGRLVQTNGSQLLLEVTDPWKRMVVVSGEYIMELLEN